MGGCAHPPSGFRRHIWNIFWGSSTFPGRHLENWLRRRFSCLSLFVYQHCHKIVVIYQYCKKKVVIYQHLSLEIKTHLVKNTVYTWLPHLPPRSAPKLRTRNRNVETNIGYLPTLAQNSAYLPSCDCLEYWRRPSPCMFLSIIICKYNICQGTIP